LLAGAGSGAAAEIPVALKDAPGRAMVENLCSGCHSLDYIRINAPFMNRQVWTASVNKMIQAFGAPISQPDAAAIIDYLTTNYGPPG
jgi:hypothetical protein